MVEQGARVTVRSRFLGEWCRGFEIVDVVKGDGGYRVRRTSDGAVLPVVFSADDVTEEPAALIPDRR